MKLLIVTQAVDKADPVLGFFHRWLEEFGKQCDEVTVIAQRVGDHALPPNVRVFSLGKETGRGRLMQILWYKRLIWRERKRYEAAFVHMTPIWTVFGRFIWKVTGKRHYLWYESRGNRWPLRMALKSVQKVFSASEHGLPFPFKRQVVTGHGIDTDTFKPAQLDTRDKGSLLSTGRITKAKRIPLLIQCLSQLPEQYSLRLAGAPVTDADQEELKAVQALIAEKTLEKRVKIGSLTQAELLPELRKADMFLHASVTPLDKAVLEAMSCGCLVLSCAPALASTLPAECVCLPEKMSERVQALSALPEAEEKVLREKLRGIVLEKHALKNLIQRLVREMA